VGLVVGPAGLPLAEPQRLLGRQPPVGCLYGATNQRLWRAAATTARVGIPIAHCQNDWPSFDLGLSVVPRRDHEPANQTGDHRTWGHGADTAWGRGADAVVFLTPASAMAADRVAEGPPPNIHSRHAEMRVFSHGAIRETSLNFPLSAQIVSFGSRPRRYPSGTRHRGDRQKPARP
jgi:hypothetical protein